MHKLKTLVFPVAGCVDLNNTSCTDVQSCKVNSNTNRWCAQDAIHHTHLDDVKTRQGEGVSFFVIFIRKFEGSEGEWDITKRTEVLPKVFSQVDDVISTEDAEWANYQATLRKECLLTGKSSFSPNIAHSHEYFTNAAMTLASF